MPTDPTDSNLIIFEPKIGDEVLTLSKDIVDPERTVIVDTNYLTQVNHKDLVSMFLNPDYEKGIRSTLKKQMAHLFRNFMEQKITLCFSIFIMREFIGRVPKREDLLDIYTRNIVVISPKTNLETCFLDLAAAVNSQIISETGEAADLKDTYSYLLAALAGVKFFVTEDKDLKRVYKYFNRMNKKSSDLQKKEIRKIIKMYGLLCDDTTFPIKRILNYLFFDPFFVSLPIPISLSELESSLPIVLDKFDNILLIFDSLQEIDSIKKYLTELPDGWDQNTIEIGKKRILEVASSVGFEKNDPIDKCFLKVKLIEKEALWSQKSSDAQLALDLSSQLSKLHASLYEQEFEPEYSTLEDRLSVEEPIKKFNVMCDQCGNNLVIEAYYEGVVLVEQRNMGPEFYHDWSSREKCPKCGNEIELTHELWEYPQFWFNGEDTECVGCTLVRERKVEKSSTTLLDFT